MRYSVSVPIGGTVSYNFTMTNLQTFLSKLWIELPNGKVPDSRQFLGPWPVLQRDGTMAAEWALQSVYRISELAMRSTWDIVRVADGWRLQYLGVTPTSASQIETTLMWKPPEGIEIFLVLRVPIKPSFTALESSMLGDNIKVELLRGDNGYTPYMFMRHGNAPLRAAPLPNVWVDTGKLCTGTLAPDLHTQITILGPAFVYGDKLFEHVQTTRWNRDLAPSDLNCVLKFDSEGKPLPVDPGEMWQQGRQTAESMAATRLMEIAFPLSRSRESGGESEEEKEEE